MDASPPPTPAPGEVTQLLEKVRAGDKDAENRLYAIVEPHLRRLAQSFLNRERPNHTLQGTELVSELYLRLAGAELSLRNRAHFFAIAARAMRRELIDYARRRPNGSFIPFSEAPEKAIASENGIVQALMVDELLDQMPEPVDRSIVELKYFFGMTDEESAAALDLPLRTLQKRWQDARIWLFERAEARQWKPSPELKTLKATTN